MTHTINWAEIQAIFTEALELPLHERAGFLDARCGDRPAVRAEIDALLAADGDVGAFLEGSAIEKDGDLTGLRVGAFRLVREIGRGGMSVVY